MDYFFYMNMIRNILMTFFQSGVWVVGFFFLVNKAFKVNEKAQKVMTIAAIICLTFLFAYAVSSSI